MRIRLVTFPITLILLAASLVAGSGLNSNEAMEAALRAYTAGDYTKAVQILQSASAAHSGLGLFPCHAPAARMVGARVVLPDCARGAADPLRLAAVARSAHDRCGRVAVAASCAALADRVVVRQRDPRRVGCVHQSPC